MQENRPLENKIKLLFVFNKCVFLRTSGHDGSTFEVLYVILLSEVKDTWVKVFRINPKFRILRLTFLRKSASKC